MSVFRTAMQFFLLVWALTPAVSLADTNAKLELVIRELDSTVMSAAQRQRYLGMIQRDIRRRRDHANAVNRAQWKKISTRAEWEAYRDERIRRLQSSLGSMPRSADRDLEWTLTGAVKGDRFQILNVAYETRPDVWVSANLYVPDAPWYHDSPKSMPGLIIVHSHHRDKTHGELQDMGMTWARAGCQVLVIDQVGYGERRAHPFHSQDDFDGDFKSWRQDYYFRYDSGSQLRLAGDSLMGWFVWDLMRAVDLLLQQPKIDPQRIVILGSVAGGGDPCAVAAALDARVAGAVPFNFGGLQPESYPLPENAEETFNFAMSSYWDSTRGLPGTCSEEFFHWTIVGSIAPRPLIYAHEFMWDRQHDPVWKRFQKIYGDFYGKPNHLAFAVGKGSVRDSSDVATHCTHIGRHHRTYIHPAFAKWFGIEATEYSQRVDKSELRCFTKEFRKEKRPLPLPTAIHRLASSHVALARPKNSAARATSEIRDQLRQGLSKWIPTQVDQPKVLNQDADVIKGISVRRLLLETEEDVVVPLMMLAPKDLEVGKQRVVVAVAQSGKAAFLQDRAKTIARLLNKQCAVCVVDVRGVGETREGEKPGRRGRTSQDVGLSVNMEMFGESLLGQRLRDLRGVLRYLRSRPDVESQIALWGDSMIAPNDLDTPEVVPHGVTRNGRSPEPGGGMLALLAGLYDDEIAGIAVRRGLSSYLTALESSMMRLPHDAVIPQILNVADVPDLAAALDGIPLRISSTVDAHNQRVPLGVMRKLYQRLPAKQRQRTQLLDEEDDQRLADWLANCFR